MCVYVCEGVIVQQHVLRPVVADVCVVVCVVCLFVCLWFFSFVIAVMLITRTF